MGAVVVEKKPAQEERCASRLEPYKTYRIVKINWRDSDRKEWASEGDILVAISGFHSDFVLNTNDSKILHSTTGFLDRVICVRDFSIQSVSLAFDDNEMPA